MSDCCMENPFSDDHYYGDDGITCEYCGHERVEDE